MENPITVVKESDWFLYCVHVGHVGIKIIAGEAHRAADGVHLV